ncbi:MULTISPECIES: DoxX family protein [Alphaproteobacteria]|uniref:DoxX family protein n=1 Tax=Alphaproteobacteria TaxID=28211 RepID=UPI003263CD59
MVNESTAPYAALILRISLGVMFIAHGALKVFVFTPAGTVGFFGSIGLPAIFAYLTIIAEIGGGAALIAGFATRLVSIATLPILLGAIFLVHGANGWLYSNPNGGWEFPAFWAAALVVQALLGDGAYAIRTPKILSLTPGSFARES